MRKQKWEEKQLYRYFKRQPNDIARKTESLLITAQNNAIKTIYDNAKIDGTQQNCK